MLRALFLFIGLSCLSCIWAIAPVDAKITLTGKVLEAGSGLPVPGAEVAFPDLGVHTFSDGEGRYALHDLPSAKALVKVVMMGYVTFTETIDLALVTTKDFALVPSVTEMNNVVITGSAKATELRREPVPMVLIGREFLRENPSFNIIGALDRVPGISTVTTGPGVSKPYIRGLGGSRVLTLFDGVRQEDQQWGEEHGVEIDPFLIDKVEVVKGPASLIYGSDALAGVVNLLPAPAAPAGTLRGAALAGFDSNNKALSGSVNVDGNNGKWLYGGRISSTVAGNYSNPVDGRVFGTKYDRKDINGYLGLNRAWGFARLRFGAHDNLLEIPDGSRDSTSRKFTYPVDDAGDEWRIADGAMLNSYRIGAIHQHVQRRYAQASAGFNLGDDRITAQVGFQNSMRREYDHPDHPQVAGLFLVLNTLTYDAKYHLADHGGWSATAGLNGMCQWNTADRGTEFLIPGYVSMDAGAFVLGKRKVGSVDISGGLRYDMRNMNGNALFSRVDPATGLEEAVSGNVAGAEEVFAGTFRHFGGLSGGLGAAWNLKDGLTLKANVGRGYRAPNAAELLAQGVHAGEGLMQAGNPAMKPEFNLQGDAGLFFTGTHITASLELFSNTVSNYIYNEKVAAQHGGDSLFVQDGKAFPVFQFRQTKALLQGGEVSVDIHPHPLDRLHFENTLAYVHAVNLGGDGSAVTDSTRYLPMIAPLHGSSELRYELGKWGRFGGLFIKAGVQVYWAQDRFFSAYGTETRTPGYHLFDAALGGDVLDRHGRTVLTFTVAGTNLADAAYQSNMSRLKYFEPWPGNGSGHSGIYNMGRNVSLRIQVPFNLKRRTGAENAS